MIDLHSHVLPGIDDGARELADAHAMLRRWQALGFRTVVATPHLTRRLDDAYLARVDRALEQVRALAAPLGVEVCRGFEIMLGPDLPARLLDGEPVTLAGGHAVLVELPFAQWPLYADQTLFAVQTAGFQPILAHPERYAAVQRDPALALNLAARGVALQVSIGSLVGLYGRRAQQAAEKLLDRRAVAVVASDAHSSGRVFDLLGPGLARLRADGDDTAASLLVDRPRALLDGQPTMLPMPATAAAEPTWQRLLRRVTRPFAP